MKTADEILSMVNEFLANLPYERKPKSLYEPIRYVLSMGGKRIRPTLMLLGYNLFKDNPEKILTGPRKKQEPAYRNPSYENHERTRNSTKNDNK